MKNLYYFIIAFFLSGCSAGNVDITGTAKGMDGAPVSILDLEGKTIFSFSIQSGKFSIKKQLPQAGYYTLSILDGSEPRDYEIYLEPSSYTIDIPEKETDYLKVTTTSPTQTKLSAYYNFENSIMDKFRQEEAMWKAKLNDPDIKNASPAELSTIMTKIQSARTREYGLHIAVMDSFIKKYPTNDIVPHIITNMQYEKDPHTYYILYKKLKPEIQNNEEGELIGEKLQQLTNSTNIH